MQEKARRGEGTTGKLLLGTQGTWERELSERLQIE